MLDQNEVKMNSWTKQIKIKENVTDHTGTLLQNYRKGKGVAYTNDYFCIGNTCVSAQLFWMVIPGVNMGYDNKINNATKEFVILIPHKLSDSGTRHIYGDKSAAVISQRVRRSSNIQHICKTDHRWHFTPPVLNTKVNTIPWKPYCDICNYG